MQHRGIARKVGVVSKISAPRIELRRVRVHDTVGMAASSEGSVPTFKAIVVEKSDGGQKVGLTDFDEANLMPGDVTVRIEWSTVNYKGIGRNPSRRLRGKGAGQGRLAGAIAGAQ
jgi:hypothetical protein